MNIFVLHRDPIQAAIWQCDKHIVKMPLESAQLLTTAVHTAGGLSPYKPTHIHHPCTRWVMASRQHFDWLTLHGLALCLEYSNRYGKTHKCQSVIEQARTQRHLIEENGWTQQPQAIKDEKYHRDDVVVAYREYYKGDKAHFATWKKNQPPWWPNF